MTHEAYKKGFPTGRQDEKFELFQLSFSRKSCVGIPENFHILLSTRRATILTKQRKTIEEAIHNLQCKSTS